MKWRFKPRLTVAMLGLIVVLVAVFLTFIRPINEYRAIAIAVRFARKVDPGSNVESADASAQWVSNPGIWRVTLYDHGATQLHFLVRPDGGCKEVGLDEWYHP